MVPLNSFRGMVRWAMPHRRRNRYSASRRKWPCRPHVETLEARLVLFDHTWSHGTCLNLCDELNWSVESNWSNGSPAGDPDPAGAVVIFPEDAGSGWDTNIDDIPGELPVKSLFYHRGGFESDAEALGYSLLLNQDIYTDLAGTNTVNIPIRFTSDAGNYEHQIQVNNNGELDLDGNLTGAPSVVLDNTGTGKLVLSGDNGDYAGSLFLEQGTVQLNGSQALTGHMTMIGVDNGAILDLNNFDAAMVVKNYVRGAIRLGSGTLSFTGGSMVDIEGMISGSGGLTIDGNGAVVTLGAHGTFSYTGPTLINTGTLRVDATLGSSPITVQQGGTLGGGGTVGSVDVRGGLLHPASGGTSASGLLVQGNVLLEAGSSFEADIRGSGTNQYDHLTATGTIDLSNGRTTLTVTGGANSAEGDTFTILHSSAGIVGTFGGLPDGTVFTVDHKIFRINYTTNDVVLTHLPQFITPPTYYPDGVGGDPHGLAMGDFNGDGTPDLVAVNGDNVSVLLGNGDGTFQSLPSINIPGSQLHTVAVGDFNGDGILDLAVAGGPSYSGTVYVLLGNGDGTFQAPVSYAVGAYPADIEVADVNGDGIPDLVVYNQNDGVFNDWTGSISILCGNGDGTFQSATTPPPFPFHNYTTAAFAFLVDPDTGRIDLVVGNNRGIGGHDSVISLLVNQGNDADGHAMFQRMDYPTMSDINALTVADFNGDGLPDVLWVANGGVGVYLGMVGGLFQSTPITSTTGANGSAVAVGDFDGDGNLDIAIPAGGGAGSPGLIVLYGHGDGTFGPPSTYAVNGGYDPPLGVLAGDFNGDGAPDLAVLTEYFAVTPAHVAVLLNMGFGSGPAPHRGQRSPRPVRTLTDAARAAFLEPIGSPGTTTAATSPADGDTPTGVLPSPSPLVPTLTVSDEDRFFAALTPDDSGIGFSRRRPPLVSVWDDALAWEVGSDDWLAPENLATDWGMG